MRQEGDKMRRDRQGGNRRRYGRMERWGRNTRGWEGYGTKVDAVKEDMMLWGWGRTI